MNENFGYELDFLPVGNGENSGDAIAIRYGISGSYKIMIVDGGTKESGKRLVEHVKQYYESNDVDYVVNTHPDKDHASGLTEVLKNLNVRELWLHRPWLYVKDIMNYVNNNPRLKIDGRVTENSLNQKFQNEYYKYAKELENIAIGKKITIKEPYQGCKIGDFYVLSPNIEWYLFDLIVNSEKTSDIKQFTTESMVLKIITTVFNVVENFGLETLKENGITSNENESSVILYANFNNRGILLTGDSGNEALSRAYEFALKHNIDLSKNLQFIQIPHHGSRRNISPSVLNKIIGNIGQQKENSITAFVSVGKEDTRHPRRVVTNAFIRRGCKVIETKGSTKHHYRNMPDRQGWIIAEPTKFYDIVEKYE